MRCLFCVVSTLSLTACTLAPVFPGISEPSLLAAHRAISAEQALPACLSQATVTPVHIQRVTDGDTVVLQDERRVRLIGLNALEMNTSASADKQFAIAATRALEKLLTQQPVYLVAGEEKLDRYGRTLAHIQLADGQNAARSLIDQGLALAVAVGKNTRCANDFLDAEHQARRQQLGIWAQPGQWMLEQTQLLAGARGFRLVNSTIKEITGSKRQRRLILENGLSVYPGRHWPTNSQGQNLSNTDLLGQSIEVRGWIGHSKGRATLSVHHPAYLILDHLAER